LKYILFDTKGKLYDQLVKHIQYHSLSDLLVELMQVNLAFESLRLRSASSNYVGEGSSLVDDENEGKINVDGSDSDETKESSKRGE